jgi:hypothetical protein
MRRELTMRASARVRHAVRTLLVTAVSTTATMGVVQSPIHLPTPGQTGHSAVHRAKDVSRSGVRPLAPVEGWTGFAFDACRAPSQRTMDRWRTSSPFLGVGIYIGGSLRACEQPHLTRGWVARQLRSGWKLLPIWVGPQASCSGFHRRIDGHQGARGRYPIAGRQGLRAARGARAAARSLGLPAGTTLWYDIEFFSTRSERCRGSSLRFLSAWTNQMHRAGYRSGVYSSVSSAVRLLSRVGAHGPHGYAAPDHVWFAWANGRANTSAGRYVRSARWKQHHRVHQYSLDDAASYGGVRMHIDRNFVDLGVSGNARREPGPCGHRADRRWYAPVRRDVPAALVRTTQCLLRTSGHYRGMVGEGYGRATSDAVRSFQRARHLPANGRTDARTWTALLATGTRPVVKRGSTGAPVRRLQRALNAALPGSIPVSGYFGPRTADLVRSYQGRIGHRVTGVVAGPTWSALRHGRLSHAHHRHHHPHRHHWHHHRHHKHHHGKHHH